MDFKEIWSYTFDAVCYGEVLCMADYQGLYPSWLGWSALVIFPYLLFALYLIRVARRNT